MNTSLAKRLDHLRKQSLDFHQQLESQGAENVAELLNQLHALHDNLVLIKHLQEQEKQHNEELALSPQSPQINSEVEQEPLQYKKEMVSEIKSIEISETITQLDEVVERVVSSIPENIEPSKSEESIEEESLFAPITEEEIKECFNETESLEVETTQEEHLTSIEESGINTIQGSFYQEDVKENFRYVLSDLNEKNKRDDDSLASKLKKTKIDDLKSAVALNQRFLFSNELFGGNMEAFNRALNELNHLENMDEALRYIDLQLSKNYNWKKDSETVVDFLSLIERRFI